MLRDAVLFLFYLQVLIILISICSYHAQHEYDAIRISMMIVFVVTSFFLFRIWKVIGEVEKVNFDTPNNESKRKYLLSILQVAENCTFVSKFVEGFLALADLRKFDKNAFRYIDVLQMSGNYFLMLPIASCLLIFPIIFLIEYTYKEKKRVNNHYTITNPFVVTLS